MKEAGDIVAVSAPLVCGMAAAAVIGPQEAGASVSLLAAIVPVLAIHFLKRPRAAVCVAFFLIGYFCFCSASLLDGGHRIQSVLSSDWLCRLIEDTPFGHDSTGAIVKALLTGRREDVGPETTAAFRKSGAAHILALSGLHLGVLYALVSGIFSIIGNSRRAACVRSLSAILLSGGYTLMTGAGASTVRAFLFILIRETLKMSPGRKLSGTGVLCLSLTLQTAADPLVIKSAGFQLSYLAMLGIFTVFPILKGWYPTTGKSARFDIFKKIWDAAALTVSCQLFTGPLAYFLFGTFPEHFLITNLIAMPLTELLVVSAAATVTLHGVNRCPQALIGLTDMLAQTLIRSLHIISSI